MTVIWISKDYNGKYGYYCGKIKAKNANGNKAVMWEQNVDNSSTFFVTNYDYRISFISKFVIYVKATANHKYNQYNWNPYNDCP